MKWRWNFVFMLVAHITLAQDGPARSWRLANELEKLHHDSLALLHFERIIAADPSNALALIRASRLESNLGARTTKASLGTLHIHQATLYANRAIQLAPGNKEAHLNYIRALGLASEIAGSPSEKLRYARIIKSEADLLLAMDSTYAAAHYALGKWHLSLASLSWLERTTCDMLFGGVPEGGSLTKALDHFEKAIGLQPDYILFHYNKALALHRAGQEKESLETLAYAIGLPLAEPDDRIRKNKCLALMRELSEVP